MAASRGRDNTGADARAQRDGDRLTDLETIMWQVERDPFLSSTFGSVTVLDQLPHRERLERRLTQMVRSIPRLRQRVEPGLGVLAPPAWRDDPAFDLNHHIRRVALPAPGGWPELAELTHRFVSDPLDRQRPLWQYLIVEGFDRSRAALVQKTHHVLTDGIGGVRMSEQFVDLTRDPDGAPRDADEPLTITTAGRVGPAAVITDAVAHSLRRSSGALWGLTTGITTGVAGDLLHPDRALARPVAVVDAARSTVRQLLAADRARSPLWTSRSLQRAFTTFDVDFDDAYRAAKALGGTLNDLFVTAAAGGAGAYHREKGAPVDELRMAMPVSTRRDRTAGGNAFVPTRVLVPAGEVDPIRRFATVRAALTTTRHEPAIELAGAYAGMAVLLPAPVLAGAARRRTASVDFTTSNVRAAPIELYIAGARIDATYALGPLAGTAFNLTMMSYHGVLHLGLHLDRRAIEDPELLRRCLEASFAELVDAGR
jgi:diacylglycerol O-acyltransferase / wax synthase